MGSLSGVLGHLPQVGPLKNLAKAEVDDRKIAHFEAIINSMTPRERENPKVLTGSRRLRIAKGSGRPVHEVNQLVKQFQEMQKMMKKPQLQKMLGGLK
jgi:signal recognition particle subunit SRP54